MRISQESPDVRLDERCGEQEFTQDGNDPLGVRSALRVVEPTLSELMRSRFMLC